MNRLAALILVTALASAGDVSGNQGQITLRNLNTADRRVADTAWKLLHFNADLCESTKMGIGWQLHSLAQYSPALRSELQDSRAAHPFLPIILAVPPDTPAQRAGFVEGDQIIAINGRSLTVPQEEPYRASYYSFDQQLEEIDQELVQPKAYVEITRSGQRSILLVEPTSLCAVDVQVEPSLAINARAGKAVIAMDWGLVHYTENEEELAILIGHELAHVISYNADASIWNRALDATPMGLFRREGAADRLGLYLAARAGYDVSGAATFWRRFGRDNLRARWTQWGHPSANARADALEAVIADIAAKQRAGQEVLP